MSSTDYRSVSVQTVLIWNESMLHTPLIIFSYWFFFLSRPHLGSWFQDKGASCMSRVCFIRSDFVLFLLLFLLVWPNWQKKNDFFVEVSRSNLVLSFPKNNDPPYVAVSFGWYSSPPTFCYFFFFTRDCLRALQSSEHAPATPIDLNEIRHAVTWKRVV